MREIKTEIRGGRSTCEAEGVPPSREAAGVSKGVCVEGGKFF